MNMSRIAIFIFMLLHFACRKGPNPAELVQGTWQLSGAELHMENMDSREWTSYIYFNDSITQNCMDIDGCNEVIDSLSKGQTTWEINPNSLLLNGWKSYEHQYVYPSMRFYPTADGSARVFLVEFVNERRLVVTGRETYESLGDTNYHYYSTLYFDRLP